MATPKRLQLKPDRSLIDPSFESYKLSLDSTPCFSTEYQVSGLRTASDDQYSLLHCKLFARTNVLVPDPFNVGVVFLLDKDKICRVVFDTESGVSANPEILTVWSLPAGLREPKSGDYNISLVFASHTICFVGDGTGMLFIIDTDERRSSRCRPWKTLFHDEISGKNRPFVVVAAFMPEVIAGKAKSVHCLLHYVEEKSKVDGLDPAKVSEKYQFVNVIEWMTFGAEVECWGLERVRRFAFIGDVDYVQLIDVAESIRMTVATDKPFFHIYDSSGVMAEDIVSIEEAKKNVPKFLWFQNVEDIIVWLPIPRNVGKKEIKVNMKAREIEVVVAQETKLVGELWNVVDSDYLTWTIQDQKLELNLSKASEGLIWQRFLKDAEQDGEEISNPAMVDEIFSAVADQGTPLPAYNAQELEDCDALPDDAFSLQVFDGESNRPVLTVPLSAHQLLFTVSHIIPPTFCLRHDVDGFVWQPKVVDDHLDFDHVETFSALGYVQASKTQRKFTVASPSLSYSAIAETSRRVFVYRQPTAIASEFDLRHRKSGRRVNQVAKQQVLNVEGNEDIMGIAATDFTLVVATPVSIYCFRL